MTEYNAATHGDVDIIFIGGGTAACVTAGRLAKANSGLKILIIERGSKSFEDPAVRHPILYHSHLTPSSKTAIFYKSQPSEHVHGRQVIVPAGGTLGGGSAINFMMYTRPQAVDFDSWETPGWGADDMMPLCNKLETFCQDEADIDKRKHGYDGPVHISDGGYRSEAENAFLQTVKDMGMDEIVDLQDFHQVGGFSRWQRYVSKDGNRQDAAYCYLHPLVQGSQHPNLLFLLHTNVIRVTFDASDGGPPRAIGVDYIANSGHYTPNMNRHSVKAKKLIVVSAGALGTPQVLERSGVGSRKSLGDAGVAVVVDLPGVGKNYQDHTLIRCAYKSSLDPPEDLHGIFSNPKGFAEAVAQHKAIIGWNGIDISSKIAMTQAEVGSQDSQFQEHWGRDFRPRPTRPLAICGFAHPFRRDESLSHPGNYAVFTCLAAYPYSRGSIHITSAEDVISGYAFDAGYLGHDFDLKVLVWAYKKTREVARRLPFCTGELEEAQPMFKDGSRAKLSDSDYAGTIHNNVAYSADDDAAIEGWIRDNVSTGWHSLGTCAMRPVENDGVVDAGLNVHGTRNLKVVDLSVVPENVGANTNNTALMIGEKAALIIASELGIQV